MSVKAARLPQKTYLSVALLSGIFVAAYFFLRTLPDAQCGFLHYVEIINEDGEFELCATNHAGFIDLSVFSYPVVTNLVTDGPLQIGVKSRVSMHLENSGGMSIAPHELAVTHTEKMHVMVIDPSLEDYHHLHPTPVGLDGEYTFEFEPARSGKYRVFTEVVPMRSRRQAVALSDLQVLGEVKSPEFSASSISVVNGLRFELSGLTDDLRAGRDYRFELDVTDAESSEPAQLETVMDAKGHMVAFDGAGKGFAHMHPLDSVIGARSTPAANLEKDAPLAFLFNVPNPGWYRLFAQIQIDGEPVFGRFDLNVK